MKLLKQKGSGEIYVWDAELAKRDDMEEYVKPEVQSEPAPVEQAEIEETSEVQNEQVDSEGNQEARSTKKGTGRKTRSKDSGEAA